MYLRCVRQAVLLVVALRGRKGVYIDRRLLTSSRAVEGLVEWYIVGEEAAVAKVEATALNATSVVHALCVVCGGVAGEAACGELGPGAIDVAGPLIIVQNPAADIASGIDEILQE